MFVCKVLKVPTWIFFVRTSSGSMVRTSPSWSDACRITNLLEAIEFFHLSTAGGLESKVLVLSHRNVFGFLKASQQNPNGDKLPLNPKHP